MHHGVGEVDDKRESWGAGSSPPYMGVVDQQNSGMCLVFSPTSHHHNILFLCFSLIVSCVCVLLLVSSCC